MALLAACSGALLFAAPPAGAVTSAQIVQVINAERAANGIPPVRENPALSAGCAQYDNYRRMNGGLANAFTPGREIAGMPGYTAAGAQASKNSLLNAGDRPADSWTAGDVFDDAPNHLRALMDPAVAVVGADQLDFDVGSFFGTASLTCVDVRSAPPRKPPRRFKQYLYAGPDGRVPFDPVYREGPSGIGAHLFLYFTVPKGTAVSLTSLVLKRPDGTTAKPSYVAFYGGLRDGRARAAGRALPNPQSPPAPGNSKVVEVGVKLPDPQDVLSGKVKLTPQQGRKVAELIDYALTHIVH